MKYNLTAKSRAFERVKKDFEVGKFSHAYLLIGEDQESLVDLARLMACLINCKTHKPCLNCTICDRIQKGIFTDVVEKGLSSAVVVADIVKITEDSIISAFEGENKVYILYNCDEMNDASSNKLLKTLEEPPKNVYFILCAKNEFALLQTIKSRTEKVYLDNYSVQDIAKELEQMGIEHSLAQIGAGLSLGQISNAVAFVKDEQYLKIYNLVCFVFEHLNEVSSVARICSKVLDFKEQFERVLDVCCSYARDFYMYKIKAIDCIDNKTLIEKFEKLQANYSKQALLKIIQKIIDLKVKISYNVNVVELIDEFLFYFVEVKYKCKE